MKFQVVINELTLQVTPLVATLQITPSVATKGYPTLIPYHKLPHSQYGITQTIPQIKWGSRPLLIVSMAVMTVLHSVDVAHFTHSVVISSLFND